MSAAEGPLRSIPTEEDVFAVLRRVYDPEVPVSIYDMGLIYGVQVEPDGVVRIEMTLTAPGCPVAVSLPVEVRDSVLAVHGVTDVVVEVVWDPPWTPDRMSEEAKLELGWL